MLNRSLPYILGFSRKKRSSKSKKNEQATLCIIVVYGVVECYCNNPVIAIHEYDDSINCGNWDNLTTTCPHLLLLQKTPTSDIMRSPKVPMTSCRFTVVLNPADTGTMVEVPWGDAAVEVLNPVPNVGMRWVVDALEAPGVFRPPGRIVTVTT